LKKENKTKTTPLIPLVRGNRKALPDKGGLGGFLLPSLDKEGLGAVEESENAIKKSPLFRSDFLILTS